MIYLAYGVAWISTAIAVSIGIYYTKDVNCLWALLLPAYIGISSNDNKDSKKEN